MARNRKPMNNLYYFKFHNGFYKIGYCSEPRNRYNYKVFSSIEEVYVTICEFEIIARYLEQLILAEFSEYRCRVHFVNNAFTTEDIEIPTGVTEFFNEDIFPTRDDFDHYCYQKTQIFREYLRGSIYKDIDKLVDKLLKEARLRQMRLDSDLT
jgi:hypothetical protein